MMRKTLILLVVTLLLPWGTATAQRMYKWVDSQGNVSYHDRPPPDSGYRVEERQIKGGRDRGADESAEVAGKSPVVLYMVPKCAPCDQARSHLQKRKIPFSEKNVEKDVKLQEELRTKAGALSVPALTVGAKVLNSYSEGWLDSELDQAGYPKLESAKPAEEKVPENPTNLAPTQ